MVDEYCRIEREPHQDHRQQRQGTGEQAAVPYSQIEPGQRAAFQCPPNGDPLLFELERNRDRHKAEHRSGHQGQPSKITVRLRFQPHQPDHHHRKHYRLNDRQNSDDVTQTTIDHRLTGEEEERNTGQHRRHPRPSVTEHPSPENQWKQHERRPGQNVEEQHLPPGGAAHKLEVHGDKGREHGNRRQEIPPLYAGQHEQRDHQDEMRRNNQGQYRRTRHLRRGDGHALRQEKTRGGPSGKHVQSHVPGTKTSTSQRPPDHTESRHHNRADHRHRGPGRLPGGTLKGQQHHHGGHQSGNK